MAGSFPRLKGIEMKGACRSLVRLFKASEESRDFKSINHPVVKDI
jgi:hypothetical protein